MPLCTLLYQLLQCCDFCHRFGGKYSYCTRVYIMKVEPESLSVTMIPTYGNNGLENKSTADTDFI